MSRSKKTSRTVPYIRDFIFGWLPWVVFSGLILRGAVLPPEKIPHWLLQYSDKHVHSAEFFILFWFTWNALRRIPKLTFKAVLTAVFCYGAFLGILTEVMQYWAPGRFPDIQDFTADMIGITAAASLRCLFRRPSKGG